MPSELTLEEQAAKATHAIWSHWMHWFFNNDTPDNRIRWKRQMNTSYEALSEHERQSDRSTASRYLSPLIRAIQQQTREETARECVEIVADVDCQEHPHSYCPCGQWAAEAIARKYGREEGESK